MLYSWLNGGALTACLVVPTASHNRAATTYRSLTRLPLAHRIVDRLTYMTHTLREFVSTLVCGDDHSSTNNLLEWTADLLTHPDVKGTCRNPVLLGAPGCGKALFVRLLYHLLGEDAVVNADDECRSERAANALVVHLDEMELVTPATPALLPGIKSLCTQSVFHMRERYRDSRTVASRHRCIITTDHEQGLLMDEAFQRHFFFTVRCGNMDDGFFHKVRELIDDPVAVREFASYLKTLGKPWVRLRAYWQARWIAQYWYKSAVEKHMAPGGRIAKRDRDAFDADFA
jgi:hypothetical protein